MGSIALPTVIFLLSVLPGFIVVNAYNKAEGAKLSYSPFTETTAKAIIYAALFQFAWIYGCQTFSGHFGIRPISYSLLQQALTGQYAFLPLGDGAGINPGLLFFYFISQYLAALVVGHGARHLVIRFNLDWVQKKSDYPKIQEFMAFLFSYEMPWFNMLKGRNATAHDTWAAEKTIKQQLSFPLTPEERADLIRKVAHELELDDFGTHLLTILNREDSRKNRALIYKYIETSCDCILELNGNDYIIKGDVHNFYYDNNGILDRLVLRNVRKRRYASLLPFVPVKGDLMVLKYQSVKSLNITYHYWLLIAADMIFNRCVALGFAPAD